MLNLDNEVENEISSDGSCLRLLGAWNYLNS